MKMSRMIMINEKYKELLVCKTTMREASLSDVKNPSSFAVDSDIEVFKLDEREGLVNLYRRMFSEEDARKGDISAVDALFTGSDEIYFIEFKDGAVSNIKPSDIHEKILNSLLIVNDVFGLSLEYARLKANYIVVCNIKDAEPITKEHRNMIPNKKHIPPIIKFNLKKFQGVYFKGIYTVNKHKFKKEFLDKWQ